MASPDQTYVLKTLQDMNDYIEAFNKDDFDTYTKYYHKNVYMNIKTMPGEKTLAGYLDWVKPLHNRVVEKLVPKKTIMDRDGKYVVVEFHTEFTAKAPEFSSENFMGKWGYIDETRGPVVKMIVFYHLDVAGKIIQLEPNSTLLCRADE